MVVIQTLNESVDQSLVENYDQVIKNGGNDYMALNKSKVLPIAEEDVNEAAYVGDDDTYQQDVIDFLNIVNEKESEVDMHRISQDLRELKDAQSADRLSSFRAHQGPVNAYVDVRISGGMSKGRAANVSKTLLK